MTMTSLDVGEKNLEGEVITLGPASRSRSSRNWKALTRTSGWAVRE